MEANAQINVLNMIQNLGLAYLKSATTTRESLWNYIQPNQFL